jgi:hypothetical protein
MWDGIRISRGKLILVTGTRKEKNLQRRLLKDKHFGHKGKSCQNSNGVTCARPPKK